MGHLKTLFAKIHRVIKVEKERGLLKIKFQNPLLIQNCEFHLGCYHQFWFSTTNLNISRTVNIRTWHLNCISKNPLLKGSDKRINESRNQSLMKKKLVWRKERVWNLLFEQGDLPMKEIIWNGYIKEGMLIIKMMKINTLESFLRIPIIDQIHCHKRINRRSVNLQIELKIY